MWLWEIMESWCDKRDVSSANQRFVTKRLSKTLTLSDSPINCSQKQAAFFAAVQSCIWRASCARCSTDGQWFNGKNIKWTNQNRLVRVLNNKSFKFLKTHMDESLVWNYQSLSWLMWFLWTNVQSRISTDYSTISTLNQQTSTSEHESILLTREADSQNSILFAQKWLKEGGEKLQSNFHLFWRGLCLYTWIFLREID